MSDAFTVPTIDLAPYVAGGSVGERAAIAAAMDAACRQPPEANRGYVPPRSEAQSLSLGVQPTNDRWSSTLHRVKPPVVDGRIRRRRSAAYFHDANAEALIAPLPGCVDAEHPARYTEVSVDAHVQAKLDGSGVGIVNDAAGAERERVLDAVVG